jgi:hypothetical protein
MTLEKQSVSLNAPDVRGGARESSYNTIEPEPCQHSITNTSSNEPCGINGDIAGTLDSSYYKGCGERQGIEREVVLDDADPVVYGISAYESNAMKSNNPNSGIYKADTIRTLDLNGGNPACNQGGMLVIENEQNAVCVCQDAYDKYTESDKSATLKQSGGVYGGGSETIVIQNVTGPLMASGYQKLGTQEAMNGMFVIQEQSEHYAEAITKE